MRVTISPAVRRRLKKARVARLATTNANGQPHVVPICFVLDGTVVYTALDRKPKRVPAARLRRVRNIESTRQAALVIDEYSEDWTRLWYVLMQGRARVVTGLSQRARAIRMLRQKYRHYASGMLADDAVVIRIDVRKLTAWGAI
jgi:coenzyme F420-0:L-glutamate ligase / coenzyme F420-1:gamma-L-glutamate ligase